MDRLEVQDEVKGLSQLLSGQAGLQDIIYNTNFPNMDIIFGGPSAPNPSGLLSENIFKILIKELKDYYNYILIDTPPIGTVIDAAVIGRCCDGAVFLIQPGNVRYRDAQKAFAQLEKSGCRILGAVLNKIDTSGDKYYSSYYKHYGEFTIGKVLPEDENKMRPNENFRKYFSEVEQPEEKTVSCRSSCLNLNFLKK